MIDTVIGLFVMFEKTRTLRMLNNVKQRIKAAVNITQSGVGNLEDSNAD